ncbi:MAG: FtsX-like permease family protein [Gammaproteobacteria bacterium]|nr:FtsX-like permease family protein [Gammaproteobacteria bacterium]
MNLVFRLAWRNLWRHPRRTWLTTGAMMFSNMLLVFMISLQFGMYGVMIDNTLQAFIGHLQIQAPGYIDDQKMRQTVAAIVPLAKSLRAELPNENIAARAAGFALLSSEERSYGIAVFGVEPEFETGVSTLPGLIAEGRYLGVDGAAEIIIGAALARNLRVGLGDELTLLGSGRDGSFAAAVVNIVGIFDSGIAEFDRGISEIPLGFFQDVFYMDGSGHQVVINHGGIDGVAELQNRVGALLPTGQELVVHDWDALQPGLQQAIKADMSSAFFMYGILVILVAFSVLNTQLMSVLERTHEFGIVMSLGLTPGRLGRLVLLETAIMGVLGLLLGALLGGLVTYWFSINGFAYPGMDELAAKFNLPARFFPQVSPLSLLLGPAVVFLFSILAAVYPALRLHKLHPVEAMRAV